MREYDYLNEYLMFASATKRKNAYNRAVRLKKLSGRKIFNDLCREFISRFRWDSSENSIATELIEKSILFSGCVAMAQLKIGNDSYEEMRAVNAIPSAMNNLSFYGYPTSVVLVDYAGRNLGTFLPVLRDNVVGVENCALIYDNFTGAWPMSNLMYYAERLLAIDSRISACIRSISGTTLISCSEEQRRDMKTQKDSEELGIPYVLNYEKNDINQIPPQLLSTPGAAEALKTLYETQDKVHADYLQSIGFRVNNEMDRRSGITPIEIIENRQNIDSGINLALYAREVGIESCKKIGIDLEVSLDFMKPKLNTFDSSGNMIGGENDDASNMAGSGATGDDA